MTMMKKAPRILRILIALLLLAAPAGCGGGRIRPTAMPPGPPPGNILGNILRADKQRDTLQALANVEVNSEEGRYPLKVALLAKRPSLLRIEAIPLVGTPDFFLALRGNILKVFLPLKGKFYLCRATRKNLALFLPLSIPLEEIAPILMGLPLGTASAQDLEKSPGTWEGNRYHLDISSGEGNIRSLWIDRATGALARVEVREDYQLRYTIRYEEYGDTDGIPMPRKVTIVPDEPSVPHLVIRYSEIRFAAARDTTKFDLPVPPGIEPIVLN